MVDFHPGYLLNAAIFAALGIVIFVVAFAIIDWMTPYASLEGDRRREEPRAGGSGGRDEHRHVHHHRRRSALDRRFEDVSCQSYCLFRYF